MARTKQIRKFSAIVDFEIDVTDEIIDVDSIEEMEKEIKSRIEEITASDVTFIEVNEGSLDENFYIEFDNEN